MDDAVNQGKTKQEDGQDKVVHHFVVAEIYQAEQLTTRNALDAIFCISKWCLDTNKVNHLR